MSKNSASAGRAFATDARRSHGRDDRYCAGRHFRIRLWRFRQCRDGVGHAKNAQQARNNCAPKLSKRETLYGEFINECSNRVMDSLERNLDKPETLLSIYALLNRIRLSRLRRRSH